MVTDDTLALFHLYTCGNKEIREIVRMRSEDPRVAIDLFLLLAARRCAAKIDVRRWVCGSTVYELCAKFRCICDETARMVGLDDAAVRSVWGHAYGLRHAQTNAVASTVNRGCWLTQMYGSIMDTCLLHEVRWELYVKLLKEFEKN